MNTLYIVFGQIIGLWFLGSWVSGDFGSMNVLSSAKHSGKESVDFVKCFDYVTFCKLFPLEILYTVWSIRLPVLRFLQRELDLVESYFVLP